MPLPNFFISKSDINIDVIRQLLAEFLGTAFLVLVGCGSTTGGGDNPPKDFEKAFCFGLTVGIMVETTGSISGGHINPAVTIGMLLLGNISILRAILYVFVQLLGAMAGAAVLFGLISSDLEPSLTKINAELSAAQGLGIEIVITFVLVFTVLSVIDPSKSNQNVTGAMVIGLSVAACHLWALKYTGASMNTARSFGPAVVMNQWDKHWVYWVGPNLGGAIAGILHRWVFAKVRGGSFERIRGCKGNEPQIP